MIEENIDDTLNLINNFEEKNNIDKQNEEILALLDENYYVYNIIVVNNYYPDLKYIKIGDFQVKIGDKYDIERNIFIDELGIPIKTNREHYEFLKTMGIIQ